LRIRPPRRTSSRNGNGEYHTINSLALPGVVAAIALTAMILTPVANGLHFVQDFTWKHALVIHAFHRGHLSQTVQEKLLADIDAQLLRLESGETDEPDEQEPSPDRTDANNPTESLGAK
jgi:hypothetical protein